MAPVVPLVSDKAREGAWSWLLRRITRDVIAGACLLRRRCTVAAVVPLVSDKAREGAWGWLLRRITRDIIAGVCLLRRITRDIIAGACLLWEGKGWHVALEEAIAAQMPKPTTGVAESVQPSWLARRAYLRLMPGSSASLTPNSRSWAAVMFPRNF